MTTVHNAKKYDEAKCTDIASRDHYNNGNYAGSTTLMQASDGTYLLVTDSNGQDLYLENNIGVCGPDFAREWLDGLNLSEKETAAAVAAGLITVVD